MTIQTIPTLDIKNIWEPDTLRDLDHACREWGFFQVINHGIANSVIEDLFGAMHEFFALPDSVKQRVAKTSDNPWGFYDRELTKNTLDWKQIYDYGPADGKLIQPQWPTGLPDFQRAINLYYQATEMLAQELIRAVACNLGMPRDYLSKCFDESHTSFLRLNYYPVCPTPARPIGLNAAPDGHLGINHHTDAGALTVLLQDQQPGLEVFRDDEWHLVEPQPGALVINIGDIIQVWSNDIYKAAMHRVVTSADQPRFSAPFFLNPDYRTNYRPLPSTTSHHRPAIYRSINWGEFRSQRAAGDYADQGEEIQISHFKNQLRPSHGVY